LLNNNLSGPIAEAVNQSFMYTVQCHWHLMYFERTFRVAL
jgi:hypothetical protein